MKPPTPSFSIIAPTTLSILLTLRADSSYLLSIILVLSSALVIQSLITCITLSICFILSTILRLELSTSCMAESTTPICCPIWLESAAIPETLSLTFITLPCVSCMIDNIPFTESSILPDVLPR